ncbi:MAG: hypothetical protein JWM68_1920 [Verrucomicrobiales bacterium]|nr:hypothetical protein [Verrucomicrobiales bacterium]
MNIWNRVGFLWSRSSVFLGLICLNLITVLRAAPGELDPTFNPGSSVSDYVLCMASQTNGKIIIGGQFTSVRGAVRNTIARLNADGTADITFNPGTGANSPVYAVVVQADGKVLIGGGFTRVNGTERDVIARLNQDGSLDTSFIPSTELNGGLVHTIALQPDGRILIGGSMNAANVTGIARLNANGSLDPTFNSGTGPNSYVESIALQTDGKILVGGWFDSYDGTNRNGMARLNANGSLDTTFNPGTGAGGNYPYVNSIAVQSDGKAIIGGFFTSINGTNRSGIARLNLNGGLDTTFDPGTGIEMASPALAYVQSVVLQPDGQILVGGNFTNFNGLPRNYITRLNPGGSLDVTFNHGSGADGLIYCIALQTNGSVVVGGNFHTMSSTNRSRIARLVADGSLDTAFNPGTGLEMITSPFHVDVFAIVVQPDAKVLLAGSFSTIAGASRNRIARLNADGSLDASFDPGAGADDSIYCMALQANGKILIGGMFFNVNGTNRSRIARLNGNGTLDTTFNPGSGVGTDGFGSLGIVNTIALQNDKILIGGDFTLVNGIQKNHLARLHSNGMVDDTFEMGTGMNGVVSSITVQTDSKVLAAGLFTKYNGVNWSKIARLYPDGLLDTSFNAGSAASGEIYSIALLTDGKVLALGNFFSFNGSPRKYMARMKTDGLVDPTFDPGAGPDTGFSAFALQADGKVVVGGPFTEIAGVARNRIARLNADGSVDIIFDPGTGANGPVWCVALQPDGRALIGGRFTVVNGQPRSAIARLWDNPGLTVQRFGNEIILSWADAVFNLQSAPIVTGTYTNVLDATSPYTTSLTGGQRFFRLQSK